MGLVNKRNAVLGWTVWQVGKRVAKRKARASVVPGTAGDSRRPNAGAILSALAAIGGVVWFVRRRRDSGTDADEGEASG